jgi:hypothetical protein
MKIEKATRRKCKIKLSVQGPSGSGKTFSSLALAKGLTGDLSKVVVIDTENGSSHLYAQLGNFSVLELAPPFSPERFIEAIEHVEHLGFDCIIIDSLSHEWFGSGGVLDIHGAMPGNSFTNWSKITPRHNALIQKIVGADIHIIATLRSKTEYVIQNNNGKSVPEKVGMKAVQREDSEYEFTLAFELSKSHLSTISKDRTGLFKNKPEVYLSEDIGKQIKDWCATDTLAPKVNKEANTLTNLIMNASDIGQLEELEHIFPEARDTLRELINAKKEEMRNHHLKFKQNGQLA